MQVYGVNFMKFDLLACNEFSNPLTIFSIQSLSEAF